MESLCVKGFLAAMHDLQMSLATGGCGATLNLCKTDMHDFSMSLHSHWKMANLVEHTCRWPATATISHQWCSGTKCRLTCLHIVSELRGGGTLFTIYSSLRDTATFPGTCMTQYGTFHSIKLLMNRTFWPEGLHQLYYTRPQTHSVHY